MKNTLLFILLALSFHTKAQTVEAFTTIPTNEYLDLLAANLEIPEEISKKYQNSTIDLTFVLTITKDGSVFNPKIQNDSLQLESNLKKAIEKLPKWNPKTENGNAVVSRKAFNLVIPIQSAEISMGVYEKAKPEEGVQTFLKTFAKKFDIGKGFNTDDIESEIRMLATFIVEKDGSLTNIKITEANSPLFHSEAIRVIKSMPKWKPATENGIPVRSDFKLPIKLRFNSK